MSAPNPGRQSPDPERVPEKVEHAVEGKADAAPSDTHAKEVSDKAKDSDVLPSNPSHILDSAADAKISLDDVMGRKWKVKDGDVE
ncbi:hypothetical protein MMC10_011291 [Thelotrema lepadinum]|nr:hypothetical protein [Thelotrema lepadinum]